ncbi:MULTISPECIES: hypothetical protein [Pseudonocardia]|uniref:DUF3040 domain-containing protein n=2 Tax=Pseudonocardia TaxID=1847 RepID=A0A1Y2MRT8_PSEAH|nr:MULTISPECIES: hypothetical protein [Pseudonocardia]OSY37936.1 hypothetical protein BG845_04342 [Pseudonocardia autotrophica]TDN74597.1 hypothetical protein C8E95_3722 [Pseudonocardia autotrophica]BBG05367.1 hypothetical protein Pdca_65760 [Pseudonocardia autotrophica]GEC29013.1 hypothetical protein PSA01_60420 [Pseudonocardia saturnea]
MSARDELRRVNELHHRAEVQRRAMMTPQERAAADYVLESERTMREGRKAAGETAMAVGVAGFFAAIVAMAALTPWLFLPVLLAGLWAARVVFKIRMGQVNRELSAAPAPWDRN